MAVFQSKYRELSFYVNGAEYKFASGTFATEDAEVIAVLEQITDAKRVDVTEKETKQEPEESKKDAESAEVAVKPAPKSRAKTSGK